ncbi:recombinase family protein [Streptomyces albus]|uniref:recombinase family protein n=1 Tax=Streptomyces albus TaxID=1888 RepID=UPI0005A7DA83|nr:recombinase family protein [Streptomyces albus]
MTVHELPATFSSRGEGEPYIGYIRVSTWREEKISPELQETALRQWAARTGRRLLEPLTYDLDVTGRNFNRKIMRDIERVERGDARGIVVWRYSRFGRNRTGNAVNLARLEAAGGQLESATEPVDASTAIGEFQREMIFAFGNFESNRAGEQWREAHEYRLAAKLPASGRARFGYIWHPRRVPDLSQPGGWRLQQERYELHPDYAPIVEEMYERKIEDHDGFNNLAHWLNEELNITTTRGRPWGVSSVSRFLDSGFAAGLLRIHDRDCKCGYGANPKMHRCPNGRMIYLAGAQPPIITPEQWEAYREHRAETKRTPPRARRATYTLTGLMRHGYCRFHMAAASNSNRHGPPEPGFWLVCSRHKHSNKLECPHGINAKREQVEGDVLRWLAEEAAAGVDAAPSVPRQRAEPAEDPQARVQRERARLQAELSKVDAAIDRLVTDNAMHPDKYPVDSFERVRDQLLGKKSTIVGQLRDLGEAAKLPTREEYKELVVGLLAEWKTIQPIERNAILKQLVRRVVCYDERDDRGRLLNVRTEIHPVWKPDPWASHPDEVIHRRDEPVR